MHIVTLLELEDEVGFIFPTEIVAWHNLTTGDALELVEMEDGFQLKKAIEPIQP
ncbi:hypothetical protein [Phyllobacterium sp. SB3]|uniref:hypothetical protein n=1 Tax=Phyllobacterium sp. SB3 TaxID=3156073 RepID=UPI0032B00EC5